MAVVGAVRHDSAVSMADHMGGDGRGGSRRGQAEHGQQGKGLRGAGGLLDILSQYVICINAILSHLHLCSVFVD